LTISFIGTNANFSIKNFAVVAMLAVPIPATANLGDSYRISVLEASGTSDGLQDEVELFPMANRIITVTNVAYTTGDSALSGWYNAGDFGNGDLKNNDVNNAFLASLGGRVPYDFSDLFNAMDVFPEDVPGTVGGDGQIRYLDWQVILYRSLRLDPINWKRSWAPGGTRVSTTTTLGGSPNLPAQSQTHLPGDVWSRQALLGAVSFEKINPSSTVDVPIYLTVAPGSAVSGLQFRATVTPDFKAAPLHLPVAFVPARGVSSPRSVDGLPMNQVACAWNLGAFEPSLQGSNVLGYLRIGLPINAVFGSCYSITFANADGSPDLRTQYDFETLPGCVWIQTTDPKALDTISVEWKTNFFGGLENPLADPTADPDGDGIPNWAEYAAGTNPTNAQSRLALLGPATGSNQLSEGFKLRWLSAPGKRYVLECTSDLLSSNWNIIATNVAGTGEMLEYVDTNRTRTAQFYRVRISP
jgi:hypothetical protein